MSMRRYSRCRSRCANDEKVGRGEGVRQSSVRETAMCAVEVVADDVVCSCLGDDLDVVVRCV